MNTPIPKAIYAWNSLHAGSFLVYTETLKDCYKFIFLPGPSEYYLTYEDFDRSITSNILEYVETLPEEIFDETLKASCLVQQIK